MKNPQVEIETVRFRGTRVTFCYITIDGEKRTYIVNNNEGMSSYYEVDEFDMIPVNRPKSWNNFVDALFSEIVENVDNYVREGLVKDGIYEYNLDEGELMFKYNHLRF